MTTRPTYTPVATFRDGWWAISIDMLDGSPTQHTQARRYKDIEPTVRDAIALLREVEPDSFDVDLVLNPTEAVKDAQRELDVAERRLAVEEMSVRRARAAIAKAAVTDSGMTMRDAGALLNLSHQRVKQLLDDAEALDR